jgi:cytosine deaminase
MNYPYFFLYFLYLLYSSAPLLLASNMKTAIINMINFSDRYWLKNAHVPHCLLEPNICLPYTSEELCLIDLEINQGQISQIIAATNKFDNTPTIDLAKKIVLPCFVDAHTHLDKGHIWERSPNQDGTFETALTTAIADAEKYWQAEDLYRRMQFGLKCSYAHGTKAIRTHLDSYGKQAEISFSVFKKLQQEWANKIILQGVSLVSLDYYQTSAGVALADLVADVGGILGGVAYENPEIEAQLDRVFNLAKERNLDLDFHADENGDRHSQCLLKIAKAAIRNQFPGKIICGHCCSLAVQSENTVKQTIELVKQAKIGVISLPMCNLYLQDRESKKTPLWRGITRVHELKAEGIEVAFSSDNCRDPFYGFGDHDVLEVFAQAVRIAHLDTPYSNWINSVTKTAAELINLPNVGKIAKGLPADLIIFSGRYFSELLARSQQERIVLRNGKSIDTTLPNYSELDDLVFNCQ